MLRFRFMLAILAIGSLKVASQTEKKGILMGISQSIILNRKNNISFVLSPELGYFLKKKMLLGLSIPPSNSSNTLQGVFVPADGYMKNKGLVCPIVRFYLFDDAKWQFYLQQSADFYQFRSNIAETQVYWNKAVLGTTFHLGLAYFIDTSTMLEFCYSRPLVKGNIDVLPISTTPYLKLGLSYIFKRKA